MNILASASMDYKTITSMITNFWLVYSKVSKGLGIAQESLQNNLGIAYFNSQNLSFNRIDPHFKRHISNSIMNGNSTISHKNTTHSRRNSIQASNSSNSASPPDSLTNSISGGIPIQIQLELADEIHSQSIAPTIYIKEIDFMQQDKQI